MSFLTFVGSTKDLQHPSNLAQEVIVKKQQQEIFTLLKCFFHTKIFSQEKITEMFLGIKNCCSIILPQTNKETNKKTHTTYRWNWFQHRGVSGFSAHPANNITSKNILITFPEMYINNYVPIFQSIAERFVGGNLKAIEKRTFRENQQGTFWERSGNQKGFAEYKFHFYFDMLYLIL